MVIWSRMPRSAVWVEVETRLASEAGARVITAGELESTECDEVEALIATSATEETLSLLPSLRVLAVPFAGVNTFPVDLLRARGIALVNAHANGRWVAERVLTLTLATLGRVIPFHRDLSRGRWHGFAADEPHEASWASLVDARVTILGAGAIARWTSRLMEPFDVDTTVFRRRPTGGATDADPFQRTSYDIVDAVSGADVVVVALPLTDETRGIVDGRVLAAMRGAIVVHVARGPVIVEEALFSALRDETLAGAAIDTWWVYPTGAKRPADATLPSRFPFHELPNVVMSPHLGGFNVRAAEASAREIGDTLIEVLAGKRDLVRDPVVDLDAGY